MSQLCCTGWRNKCSYKWVCLVAWLDDSVLQVLVANGAKIFTIDLVINQFCDKHDPMYLLLLNYFPLNFSNKSICNRILQSPLIQL
jgi:hypothetical protein